MRCFDDTPQTKFALELESLLTKWRDKPQDDAITVMEVVGVLEDAKYRILYAQNHPDEEEVG